MICVVTANIGKFLRKEKLFLQKQGNALYLYPVWGLTLFLTKTSVGRET